MRNHAVTAITILFAAALTACGGGKPAATPAVPPSAIPEELTGIWEARIPNDELAVSPDGLPGSSSVWTLKFLGTGGDDNGPSVFLSNDRAGELAGPISVSGRQITLDAERTCRKFRFEIGRHKLYLMPDDLAGCPSTAIGSVLAARGWTRPGAPTPEEEWPLERIRDEGSPGDRTVMAAGLTAREYIVCDGPRYRCENDPPLREPYQHAALELTQGGRAALFSIDASAHNWVAAVDEDSVFVMDNPHDEPAPDQLRYRLLRADGTEIPLELDLEPVPASPGPGVMVVDFSWFQGDPSAEHVFRVDERERTLRPLNLPHNADLGWMGRYWGPNAAEFLWFVSVDCRVYWVAGRTLQKHRLDCADGFEFSWAGGDFTYVHDDWFRDGWLKPGRMALLERVDDRLFLHVSLDRGVTWQRIPVSDEAAVPDTLRRLG